MISDVDFGNNCNVIAQNIGINDIKNNNVISVSEFPDESFLKFFRELSTTRIGKAGEITRNDTETIIKDISCKYKELLDELESEDLDYNQKGRKTEILNNAFSELVQQEFSSGVFIAKENEERDYHIANSNKNSIFNYDNEVYNNVIKNHNRILASLDKLENIMNNYGKNYCNAFIDNIKNNSVEDAFNKSFEEIRSNNISNISYDDAVKISFELYGKHNLYRYESLFNKIEYGMFDDFEKTDKSNKSKNSLGEFEERLSRYGNVFYKSLRDNIETI